MSTRIRFFGVAAYEIVTSKGQHILIDPFLDDNPGSPVKAHELKRVDLILVSHAAAVHIGDTESIARRTNAPVICGGDVMAYLMAKGIPGEQIRATTWGVAVKVAGIKVQPIECHAASQIEMPKESFSSGVPLAFVVYPDLGVRFYHWGGTSIFSDLKLQAALYQPTIGAIGIASPMEVRRLFPMPGQALTGEMSPREGALAAQWLGLETVLPCHYITPDVDDVQEFHRHLAAAKARGEKVPKSVVMKAGDWLEIAGADVRKLPH